MPPPTARGSVTLVGMKDAASTMPADASRLYAKNVANLLALMTQDGKVEPDFDDEVVAGRLPHARRRGPAPADRRAPRGREPSQPRTGRDRLMDGVALLTIFVLAVFVGFEVVSKVSSTLHTPLMSGANAIHGIILVGAIIVAGQATALALAVALFAVVLATVNLVGGFVVTDRMLEMFRGRASRAPRPAPEPARPPAEGGRR